MLPKSSSRLAHQRLPALLELVVRGVGIGVADAPEALDEGVALVVLLDGEEGLELLLADEQLDRGEELLVLLGQRVDALVLAAPPERRRRRGAGPARGRRGPLGGGGGSFDGARASRGSSGRATIRSLYYAICGSILRARAVESQARDAGLPRQQRHHAARSARSRGDAAVARRALGQPVLDPRARPGGPRGGRGGARAGGGAARARRPKRSSSSPPAPRPTTRCCAARRAPTRGAVTW